FSRRPEPCRRAPKDFSHSRFGTTPALGEPQWPTGLLLRHERGAKFIDHDRFRILVSGPKIIDVSYHGFDFAAEQSKIPRHFAVCANQFTVASDDSLVRKEWNITLNTPVSAKVGRCFRTARFSLLRCQIGHSPKLIASLDRLLYLSSRIDKEHIDDR